MQQSRKQCIVLYVCLLFVRMLLHLVYEYFRGRANVEATSLGGGGGRRQGPLAFSASGKVWLERAGEGMAWLTVASLLPAEGVGGVAGRTWSRRRGR